MHPSELSESVNSTEYTAALFGGGTMRGKEMGEHSAVSGNFWVGFKKVTTKVTLFYKPMQDTQK